MSYAEIMTRLEGKLDYLTTRRQSLVDKFILKTAENPRFARKWFPKRAIIDHNLRKDVFYHEAFARTDRLYNAPIFSYRRRLNELRRPGLEDDEEIITI